MTTKEALAALEALGSEQTRKIFWKHGAPKSLYGVKVGDMKQLMKQTGKKNHELAMGLFKSGNGDAMYFAGLIADEQQMTKADLQQWAEQAKWYMVSEYSVAWVATESPFAKELAAEWIEDERPHVAAAGWSTYSNILAYDKGDLLDEKLVKRLMQRIEKEIHEVPDRVRYTMNGFLIAVAGYMPELSEDAKATAQRIGKVVVNMGDTACKVPDAPTYIDKMLIRAPKKKKTVRC